MSGLRHIHVLAEDDDDPMLSAVNLVDVFLVLVVALLTAVAAQSSTARADERVTIIKNPGSPDMEIVVRDQGREIKYKGTGQMGAGQGERAGVAYRLKDGQIVYVPEARPSGPAGEGGTR